MAGDPIKEVFFDWDGTFADTEAISISLTRRVLSDCANAVFGQPMQAQLDGIDMRGKDFGQIARQFQDAVNAGLQGAAPFVIDIEDLRTNKLRPAAREALLEAQLAPGIAETVGALQQDLGAGVAVVSNSPRLRIQPLLEKHAFDARIPKQRVFSAFEDTPGKLKENPDIYLLAAKTLGITPEQAAAVEDSLTGMRAAVSAGIGLRVGYTGLAERALVEELRQALLNAGAHVVIDDMKELPAVIRARGPLSPGNAP